MSFQPRSQPMQQQQQPDKSLPPLEMSMKYAAWDIKSIPPAIKELTNEIRALRLALTNQKSGVMPDVPF